MTSKPKRTPKSDTLGNVSTATIKLKEIIEMLKHHESQVSDFIKLSFRQFTYEDHEFKSCQVCGHSDKALIYELEKVLEALSSEKGVE